MTLHLCISGFGCKVCLLEISDFCDCLLDK